MPFEGPGCIAGWARQNGHQLTSTRFYESKSDLSNIEWLNVSSIDWLIVMGGPMGVDDEEHYPWLKTEKEVIRVAIDQGKTVLGVCLGAQLIADVLGASVYPNPQKEIGWFPLKFTKEALSGGLFGDFPPEMTVFHWHGDTFDLPGKAMRLAFSEACKNQGFLYDDRVLGLQFHFEMEQVSVKGMLEEGKAELERTMGPEKKRYIQTADEILAGSAHTASANRQMDRLLERLARRCMSDIQEHV